LILHLQKGRHVVSLEAGSGEVILSVIPPDAIPAADLELVRKQHTRLFEYFVHE
jgi:hypothetical protein